MILWFHMLDDIQGHTQNVWHRVHTGFHYDDYTARRSEMCIRCVCTALHYNDNTMRRSGVYIQPFNIITTQ